VGVSSVGGAEAASTSSVGGGGPTWVRRADEPVGAGTRALLPDLSARLLSWICTSAPLEVRLWLIATQMPSVPPAESPTPAAVLAWGVSGAKGVPMVRVPSGLT
jgi:hypothetical protein